METRRYKVHGAVGGSKWETGTTLDMLESMPHMWHYLRVYRIVPPIHILNELFSSGIDEAGMSGGCEWRPFEITSSEYDELVEELITSPDYQCELDAELSRIQTEEEWGKTIMKKYRTAIGKRNGQ